MIPDPVKVFTMNFSLYCVWFIAILLTYKHIPKILDVFETSDYDDVNSTENPAKDHQSEGKLTLIHISKWFK